MKTLPIGSFNIMPGKQNKSMTFNGQPKRPTIELRVLADQLLADGKVLAADLKSSMGDFADALTPAERLAAGVISTQAK